MSNRSPNKKIGFEVSLVASFFLLFFNLFSSACAPGLARSTSTQQSNTAISPSADAEGASIDIPNPAETVLINIVYCTSDDGVELTLDMYKPSAGAGPFPVILYFHGGGWTGGDKTDGVGLFFREELNRRGYIFAAINYRLAPKYSFPAPIIDARCAIRSLRANSTNYQIDSERIGILGGSAGGQLAALVGANHEVNEWDVGEHIEQSSKVAAIVDMYGPSDLIRMFQKSQKNEFLQIFGASSIDDPLLKKYSPVTHIDPSDPPFLILHGDQDLSVPLEQSEILYNALKANGVPAEMIVVKNAGHSFISVGGKLKPSMLELAQIVGDFFDRNLK